MMMEMRLLPIGETSERSGKLFSDLSNRLENGLLRAKNLSDVEELLSNFTHAFHEGWLTLEQKIRLKRIRQKIYDRRKVLRLIDESKPITFMEEKEPMSILSAPTKIAQVQNSVSTTPAFLEGVLKAFQSIDGEIFAKNFPKVITLFLFSCAVLWFLWDQSIALYEGAGFKQPAIAAAGAILMIVGFAGFHSITKSKLALLLCFYAGGYEAFTVVSGTVHADARQSTISVEQDEQIKWLKEKASQAESSYQEAKNRFESPESKTFQNQWFKTKFVDPTWAQLQTAQDELQSQRASLLQKQSSQQATLLKVLYRLGLVFLSMLLIHQMGRMVSRRPSPMFS